MGYTSNITDNAKPRKVQRLLRKIETTLNSISKKAKETTKKKKEDQRISAGCAGMIDGLVQHAKGLVSGLQP